MGKRWGVVCMAVALGALLGTGASPAAGVVLHDNGPLVNSPGTGAGGSSVVIGDTTTNRLTSSVFSNIYRVMEGASGNTDRPIMANTVAAPVSLTAGTYWLDWQTDGSSPYTGPWAPPITIDYPSGSPQTTTGNVLQYDTISWSALVDSDPYNDFP